MSDNEYEEEDEDGFKTWALEGLEAHNEYRALHDAPPLELSKEVMTSSVLIIIFLTSFFKEMFTTKGFFFIRPEH